MYCRQKLQPGKKQYPVVSKPVMPCALHGVHTFCFQSSFHDWLKQSTINMNRACLLLCYYCLKKTFHVLPTCIYLNIGLAMSLKCLETQAHFSSYSRTALFKYHWLFLKDTLLLKIGFRCMMIQKEIENIFILETLTSPTLTHMHTIYYQSLLLLIFKRMLQRTERSCVRACLNHTNH